MKNRTSHRRAGIGGFFSTVGLALLLGVVLILLVELVFAPWIYRVGGHLRPLPFWAGAGEVHTSAGMYRIYVWFAPSLSHSKQAPGTHVTGTGFVCTPQGKSYPLMVTGGAAGSIWSSMDGQTFHLDAQHEPLSAGDPAAVRTPALSFSGRWDGARLVMSDEASLANAFLPDGTLNTHPKATWDTQAGAVPITFLESSWWYRWPDCQEQEP